ncbi:DNA-directed RNA polymerase subunit delta [Paenibacillus anaericanus]|uniref:Probable DNA-directed RNA polymerase subunit delta n=1 Tax=Paenibacillus anaericanus TaxID=170367 RepID=A0A3S1DMF4_9BACL|nr:DNA-directed RNA polymerase subunit delta [Paenibacillus anaericanus]RUT41337.1 DNA-directed RNA polymerase subunit delta [Paenibacillus anaericanus]
MSTSINLKIDPEKVFEIPMVDLAFMILKVANTPYYYRDLMKEVAKVRGMSEQESSEAIAQLYTEINIDGRFACVGTNLWGLKRWYPVEKSEDPVGNAKRPRIINDDDDDLEDDDFAEEESFTPDGDGFDKVDDDQDELFADEDEEDVEEVEEVEDEALLEDADLDEDEDELADEEDSEDDLDDSEEDK